MSENSDRTSILNFLHEVDGEMALISGYTDALIGVCRIPFCRPLAIYDYHKCIRICVDSMGWSYEHAVDMHEIKVMRNSSIQSPPAFLVSMSGAPLFDIKESIVGPSHTTLAQRITPTVAEVAEAGGCPTDDPTSACSACEDWYSKRAVEMVNIIEELSDRISDLDERNAYLESICDASRRGD